MLQTATLTAALGADVHAVGVLLTADDSTAANRLAQREIGSGLEESIERSNAVAAKLDDNASAAVQRVFTDHRDVSDIAAELPLISGWTRRAASAAVPADMSVTARRL